MIADVESFYHELEETGEEQVRNKLAQHSYHPSKSSLIEEWLRRKEEERSLKSEEAKNTIALDMLDAAKRQASAAESAASSAAEQARQARIAKNIAVIAAIMASILTIINIVITCSKN